MWLLTEIVITQVTQMMKIVRLNWIINAYSTFIDVLLIWYVDIL